MPFLTSRVTLKNLDLRIHIGLCLAVIATGVSVSPAHVHVDTKVVAITQRGFVGATIDWWWV